MPRLETEKVVEGAQAHAAPGLGIGFRRLRQGLLQADGNAVNEAPDSANKRSGERQQDIDERERPDAPKYERKGCQHD